MYLKSAKMTHFYCIQHIKSKDSFQTSCNWWCSRVTLLSCNNDCMYVTSCCSVSPTVDRPEQLSKGKTINYSNLFATDLVIMGPRWCTKGTPFFIIGFFQLNLLFPSDAFLIPDTFEPLGIWNFPKRWGKILVWIYNPFWVLNAFSYI